MLSLTLSLSLRLRISPSAAVAAVTADDHVYNGIFGMFVCCAPPPPLLCQHNGYIITNAFVYIYQYTNTCAHLACGTCTRQSDTGTKIPLSRANALLCALHVILYVFRIYAVRNTEFRHVRSTTALNRTTAATAADTIVFI